MARIAIPAPKAHVESLHKAVVALKSAVEILTGQIGSSAGKAVTWQDAINLGIIASNDPAVGSVPSTFPSISAPVIQNSLIGVIISFAGSAAPTGWLLCNGQNVKRAQYPQLFALLSTTYGVGDGSTTFGVPDLRGRFVAGLDNMGGTAANRLTGAQTGGLNANAIGATGGEQGHTSTVGELPSHTHNVSARGVIAGQVFTNSGSVNAAAGTITSDGGTGGGGAHNNVPPAIALNYIIFSGVGT